MASNNDLSPERDEEKCKKRDRNFKGRICRREEEKKGEKPNVPRERERDGLAARDIGNDFARRRGERRTDVVS